MISSVVNFAQVVLEFKTIITVTIGSKKAISFYQISLGKICFSNYISLTFFAVLKSFERDELENLNLLKLEFTKQIYERGEEHWRSENGIPNPSCNT